MNLITSYMPEGFIPSAHLALQRTAGAADPDILMPEEREEYERFSNSRRRREFLSTRTLLKQLAEEAGLDPSLLMLRKDSMGKPAATYQGREVHVSFAHSGDWSVCALSERDELGVDLEPAGREVAPGLRERILHTAEREWFAEEDMIRLWTLKEAAVKLDGRGLRVNLNEITIRPYAPSIFEAILCDDKSARICSFQCNKHWVAVACYPA